MATGRRGKGDTRPSSPRRGDAADSKRRKRNAVLTLMGMGAGAVAVLAMLVSLLLRGGLTPVDIPTFRANDTEVLKDIFFSGSPWLVHCKGPGDATDPTFLAAAPILARNAPPMSVVKTAFLDCSETLPSGKTVFQRFKLDSNLKPMIALFVNGNKPQVISQDLLDSTSLFAKRVSDVTKLKISEVSTANSFGRACLNRLNKLCIMYLPFSPLTEEQNNTIRMIGEAYRTLHFAIINTDNVELSIERSLAPLDNPEPSDYIRVVALRVFPDNTAQTLAYRGEVVEVGLRQWLDEIQSGELELTMLDKKPSASRRRRHRDTDVAGDSRAEKRKRRRDVQRMDEEEMRAADEEALAKLSPEEREAVLAAIEQKRMGREKARREEMDREADTIFDNDDVDLEDDGEDYEGYGDEDDVEEVEIE